MNPEFSNAGGFIGSHGLATNTHGRAYLSGAPLSFSEKVTIGNAYLQAREDLGGVRPNITALARACKVARRTILKVEGELMFNGKIISPVQIISGKNIPRGPGSIALTDVDAFVLLMIYHREPSTTLRGYQVGLYSATGLVVCPMTISNFFTNGFDIKGSLCKPNIIPYDKFRPENLDRSLQYLVTIVKFDRRRLKFGDEKHLKGAELWYRKTRRNVFTGHVPPGPNPIRF